MKRNFTPPDEWVLWKLRIDPRPPHFRPFLTNFLYQGLFYGTFFGLGRLMLLWDEGLNISIPWLLKFAGAMGLVVGLLFASWFEYLKSKYQLPSWEKIESENPE
jgi:hypothetical protein